MTFTKVWWKEIASSTIRNFDIDGQFYLIVLEVENICWHFWVILKPAFESFYFIRKISHANILQITAEVRKITKNVQGNLTFILTELSETANSFFKIRQLHETKNVARFINTRFYWKRGCRKICKFVETFHTSNGFKSETAVFVSGLPFSK